MLPLMDRARIQAVADRYAAFPNVRAVALGGSLATGAAGPDADADLCVYADPPLSLDERRSVVPEDARHAEVGNTFFEAGDEWTDAHRHRFDAMFRAPSWIQDQLDWVLVRHEASAGYSTCF
ncbi:MAG: nucleotidyltransferase domain-containing protein [Bacteroidota bacterium]